VRWDAAVAQSWVARAYHADRGMAAQGRQSFNYHLLHFVLIQMSLLLDMLALS